LADKRANYFNDPFVQVTDGIADCPVPKGPMITEAEMKAQAHSRVERGVPKWNARSSGFSFTIGGTVNVSAKGPGGGISAGATWINTTTTSVPPLIVEVSNAETRASIGTSSTAPQVWGLRCDHREAMRVKDFANSET